MYKRVAMCPLMDPNDEYLPYAIDSVINEVDYFLFTSNDHRWGDINARQNPEHLVQLKELVKTNPKFRLLEGSWEKEHEQHN